MRTKIIDLINKLNQANKAYYTEDKEIMSNKEYDALYDQLVELEKQTGIILSNSPTQTVGHEVSDKLQKEQHEQKMLSLNKTKSVDELSNWLGNKIGILSWKLDGLTVVLTYKNGKLQKAVTRGNGAIGEVITQNAKVFDNVPLTIPYQGKLVVRGEAVISYSDFNKINDGIDDMNAKYKNPRNLCSGSVRQLDSSIAASRHIRFIAFQLVSTHGKDFEKVEESFDWLEEAGFEVVEYFPVNKSNIKGYVKEFEEAIEFNKYPSDGLVLTYNDISYGQSLGSTGKFPRHSIAFKWEDDIVETTLLDVEWNTSRTGMINPVAIFEPVELEGTTVNRATLNNISFIEDLQLGIGDTLTVYKANMIIPTIDDNLTRSGNLEIPTQCPSCNSTTVINQENESKILLCTNPNCKSKLIKKLVHFTSRDAMNIDGLSEATLAFLVEKGWVSTFIDLYKLKMHKIEWSYCKGFGDASVNKALENIEKSKIVLPEKLLYALGISTIGRTQSAIIMKELGDWKAFYDAANNRYCFANLDGFGATMDMNIHNWFKMESNKECLDELLMLLNIQETGIKENASSKLEGLTFCITGSIEYFKNRKEMQTEIENAGGKVTGSVSAKTDYLVNNDIESSSSKNKKAKELGIPIITESDLLAMM